MPDVAGKQPVTGEHLVRPDGTVALGIYGEVFVAGLTLPEVKAAEEHHLSTQMHDPQVSVDVLAYNSKKIYVIMDGGGYGEQQVTLPCTGNETVLDAIGQVYGLSQVSSKKIWIARPAPSQYESSQILDVHWRAITREGVTTTNYQLFPGDRVYVQADHLIATDNFLGKVFAPVERFLGVVALGTGVVSGIDFYTQQGTQGGP
jgi:polysaccharide export outer membrane protein